MQMNSSKKIDVDTWKNLKSATYHNIKYLLEATKVLLDFNIEQNKEVLFEHPWVAGGLYTYAIEEYGKFLILNSYQPIEGKVTLDNRIFIKHDEKFSKAIENLPTECLSISKGLFDSKIFNSKIFNTKGTVATFNARKGIFYTDLDDENKLKMTPHVDAESLRKAVSTFSSIITKIKLE